MSREELKTEIETIICDFKTYDESIDDTSEKIMALFDKVEFKADFTIKGSDLVAPRNSDLGDKLFGFI